jgi:type IV secretion system protein VirB11
MIARALQKNNERDDRLVDKLKNELGPTILAALADPDVTDIWRNEDGVIWVNRSGESRALPRDTHPRSDFEVTNLIGTISAHVGVFVSANSPFLEGEMPIGDGRFTATLPPESRRPIFSIRKHIEKSLSLTDYVRAGVMTPAQCATIRARIKAYDNILIAGGQGAGKSTLAGAVLREIFETRDRAKERYAILEDTREICIPPGANFFSLRTNAALGTTMDQIVKRSLRHTATCYVIGELRGAEAQDFLEVLAAGQRGGLATIHAGVGREALRRFEQLIRKSGRPVDRSEIASVINLIVVIAKTAGGARVVREITRVVDGSGLDYALENIG